MHECTQTKLNRTGTVMLVRSVTGGTFRAAVYRGGRKLMAMCGTGDGTREAAIMRRDYESGRVMAGVAREATVAE